MRSLVTKNIIAEGWKVGCGHAAHSNAGYVTVVRLSDGVAWLLPKVPGSLDPYPTGVLGLTCDELFALAQVDGKTTIIRVRLDSLGPGLPPD